jgi:anti-sigma factor RsiW
MTCERYERWAALAASGDFDSREQAQFEAHLQGCPSCRILAEEFAALTSELSGMKDPAIDPAVYASIRRNVMERRSSRRFRVPLWPLLPAATAAVLAILALCWPTRLQHNIASVPTQVSTRHTVKVIPAARTVKKRQPGIARKMESGQPLVVKMLTDDPDVVIIWLVDKGD